VLKPIFDNDRHKRAMRVAAFMSGSGTNIIKILERQKELDQQFASSPFKVIFIFSDRSDGISRGEKIAYENGIPYFSYDINRFYSSRGLKKTCLTKEGMEARREFDSIADRLVKAFDIDLICLAGYMSYLTLKKCLNVHPGDLSIVTDKGKRKYVGDHAVEDAIACGESCLRSSTILIDSGIDTGPLLMVSRPLEVRLPMPLEDILKDKDTFKKIVEDHQARLKEIGDWKILPLTLEMIARGRFSLDEHNTVYFDGKPIPSGYRLE